LPADVPAPAPIELPLLPVPLDDPSVVLLGLDELELPLGLDEALLLLLGLDVLLLLEPTLLPPDAPMLLLALVLMLTLL
jgi:hypothetical protein